MKYGRCERKDGSIERIVPRWSEFIPGFLAALFGPLVAIRVAALDRLSWLVGGISPKMPCLVLPRLGASARA
jgi:hypothetical protein